MSEENDFDKIIEIGLILGVSILIAIAIKKPSIQTTQSATKPNSSQNRDKKYDIMQGWKPSPFPKVDDLKNQESSDFKTYPILNDISIPIPEKPIPEKQYSTNLLNEFASSGTRYKNKEITEYIRNEEGDIIKKIVTREAKIDDR